ncbi:MAG: two-component system response regulator YcbB [Bacillota bacterium]|nr:MAG: two-component system response regulator YcbB [Bacillota bacterium]
MTHRFFIVDDDIAVRRMLQDVIRESGLGVILGESGRGDEASDMLSNCPVDVVLVDLLLPDMDGIALVRSLKVKCKASFVMISQVQAKAMVSEAYDAGVEFFIQKPINSVEVKAVLGRVCESLRLRLAVDHIYRSVADLAASPAQVLTGRTEKTRHKVRVVLHDMGIGGESGSRYLEEAALFVADAPQGELFSVKELLVHLAGNSALSQKAAEQRMRRAVQTALRHLAALGLEDYASPRFENYAATFFDFTEVRREMRFLEGGGEYGGKISLKRFLSALVHNSLNY